MSVVLAIQTALGPVLAPPGSCDSYQGRFAGVLRHFVWQLGLGGQSGGWTWALGRADGRDESERTKREEWEMVQSARFVDRDSV